MTCLKAQGCVMGALALAVFVTNFYELNVNDLNNGNPFLIPAYEQALLRARTHCFITLATLRLWQAFQSRSPTQSLFRMNFFNNKWLIYGIGIAFALLLMCLYIPGWNNTFDQTPLDGYDWIIIISCMVMHTFFVECFKFALRRNCFRPKKEIDPESMEKQWYSAV